ncbi:MAG: class I SAM-dependent methyltransferase [Gammaproteobacteria bacterium]|nr:class I SAM-dependent methyltransferase [Gammaproteobacteria bacterium]
MKNILFVLKSMVLKGKENQSFVGAPWVAALLRATPRKFKRTLSLAVLSQSPHYFYRHLSDTHQNMRFRQFLESEFNRNRESRSKIMKLILAPYLNPESVVVDYGCGPGFLANAVSSRVRQVLAVDVSQGVLQCARNLNQQENISYLHSSEVEHIAAESVDLVYSFAVIQHVTDEVFDAILEASFRILKANGQILLHVVVDQEQQGWRNERDWVAEKSISGRVKLKWGLNCFNRSGEEVKLRLRNHGFASINLQPIESICSESLDDDIYQQHLVTAQKA